MTLLFLLSLRGSFDNFIENLSLKAILQDEGKEQILQKYGGNHRLSAEAKARGKQQVGLIGVVCTMEFQDTEKTPEAANTLASIFRKHLPASPKEKDSLVQLILRHQEFSFIQKLQKISEKDLLANPSKFLENVQSAIIELEQKYHFTLVAQATLELQGPIEKATKARLDAIMKDFEDSHTTPPFTAIEDPEGAALELRQELQELADISPSSQVFSNLVKQIVQPRHQKVTSESRIFERFVVDVREQSPQDVLSKADS